MYKEKDLNDIFHGFVKNYKEQGLEALLDVEAHYKETLHVKPYLYKIRLIVTAGGPAVYAEIWPDEGIFFQIYQQGRKPITKWFYDQIASKIWSDIAPIFEGS